MGQTISIDPRAVNDRSVGKRSFHPPLSRERDIRRQREFGPRFPQPPCRTRSPSVLVRQAADFDGCTFMGVNLQEANYAQLHFVVAYWSPGVIATGRIMATVIPGSSQSNRDRLELVALRRLGTVEDRARVVKFLATDLSD
jgi:hypothetical protein